MFAKLFISPAESKSLAPRALETLQKSGARKGMNGVFACAREVFVRLQVLAFLVSFAFSISVHAQNESEDEGVMSAAQISAQAQQQADFSHVLFAYFQEQYDQALMLIEVGDTKHQFALLSKDDQDRLRLMQGASKLNLGLYKDAQSLLLALLATSTSEYVQANTWFWVAKAGFANRQYALSEQAYAAIQENQLIEFIDEQKWQELQYLTAHVRMQQEQDWQSIYQQIKPSTIYRAYLQANLASTQFNRGNFDDAKESFISAKQALLRHERMQNSWFRLAGKSARAVLNFNWLNPFTWFAQDPNAQSQGQIEATREVKQRQEINALYDRINLGLAYTLLQQQDPENALDVINTVSAQGGDSEQAMLTLGWALAQQNRWQNALSVWQHLYEQSNGLYALQASYGMAYAYQQQGEFSRAFFALDDTTTQINRAIEDLKRFSETVKEESFFDRIMPPEALDSDKNQKDTSLAKHSNSPKRVESIAQLATALGLSPEAEAASTPPSWPLELLDVKRMFMSAQANFDAVYLLKVRQEAKQIITQLADKTQHLAILKQMLRVREQRFVERQQSLSLTELKAELSQAKAQLQSINTRLTDPQLQNDLKFAMANAEQNTHIARINNAQQRLIRLQNDTSRSRPLNPKLQTRLARVQGILQWQLENDFVAKKWQHQRLLQQAQQALEQATSSYEQLLLRQQDTEQFASQQRRIVAISEQIRKQQAHAEAVYSQATEQLQTNLMMLIEQRIAQLSAQQVNTRLAKLRLQDLNSEGQ